MQSNSYFVYFLTNFTNTVIYIGVTNNLIRRIYEHKNKFVSSFTAKYNVQKLVYFEMYDDIAHAIEREKQLKAGPRRKKVELVEKSNPYWNDLSQTIL